MLTAIVNIDRNGRGSLQAKLREKITEMIIRGDFSDGQTLPSTRALAAQIGISRNTVTLVYQDLTAEGILTAHGRSGHVVSPNATARLPNHVAPACDQDGLDWRRRLAIVPSKYPSERFPKNWRTKRYMFAFGQHDRWLFPTADWRKCSRDSLSLHDIHDWTVDYVDADDPLLLDAFRRRVLPRRGVTAHASQVLVTIGAQHALQLTAQCLVKPGTVVGIEDPGYPDARHVFSMYGAILKPLPVDENGLMVSDAVSQCDIVYVTPQCQSPTSSVMSQQRRSQLIEAAVKEDFLIIEDDYDTESHFGKQAAPALKMDDPDGRVIYVTSLSKLLSPGLRMGFLVGPGPFIREARALRRLSIRHPPANNQRTLALFLKGGHYSALLKRFHQEYERRWLTLRNAIQEQLPQAEIVSSQSGSSLWLRFSRSIDTQELAALAYERGVVIEPGKFLFADPDGPTNFLRLGFSSIKAEDIYEGIRLVAEVVEELASR